MKHATREMVAQEIARSQSEIRKRLNKMFDRARTPEAKAMLRDVERALDRAEKPSPVLEIIDIDDKILTLLEEYQEDFSRSDSAEINEMTAAIIERIFDERSDMCFCEHDPDKKRAMKEYMKSHVGGKKDLKTRFENQYSKNEEKLGKYKKKIEILMQAASSYRLDSEAERQRGVLDDIDSQIQVLKKKFIEAKNAAERGALDTQYRTLLNKQQAANAAVQRLVDENKNVQTYSSLLEEYQSIAKADKVAEGLPIEKIEHIAKLIGESNKKAAKRNDAVDEALAAAQSSNTKVIETAAGAAYGQASLGDLVAQDTQIGGAATAPSLADLIGNKQEF